MQIDYLCAEDLEATRDRVIACGGTVCRDIFASPGGVAVGVGVALLFGMLMKRKKEGGSE